MRFQVTVLDDQFQKLLAKAFQRTGDLTVPLTIISGEWFKGNKSFVNQKSLLPVWADFKNERVKKQKMAEVGFLYPMLRRHGRLFDSITDPNNPEAVNQIINKKILVVGSSVPYGIFHMTGTRIMKKRPFIFFGPEQTKTRQIKNQPTNERIELWKLILSTWIVQGKKK